MTRADWQGRIIKGRSDQKGRIRKIWQRKQRENNNGKVRLKITKWKEGMNWLRVKGH